MTNLRCRNITALSRHVVCVDLAGSALVVLSSAHRLEIVRQSRDSALASSRTRCPVYRQHHADGASTHKWTTHVDSAAGLSTCAWAGQLRSRLTTCGGLRPVLSSVGLLRSHSDRKTRAHGVVHQTSELAARTAAQVGDSSHGGCAWTSRPGCRRAHGHGRDRDRLARPMAVTLRTLIGLRPNRTP